MNSNKRDLFVVVDGKLVEVKAVSISVDKEIYHTEHLYERDDQGELKPTPYGNMFHKQSLRGII
jgi:hypothetical protein